MKKYVVVLLMVSLFLVSCNSLSNETENVTNEVANIEDVNNEIVEEIPETIKISLEDAQEDLNQMLSYIDMSHPKLYTNEDVFNDLVEETKTALHDQMTEIELVRILSPLVASLDCGHTNIFYSSDLYSEVYNSAKLLPIDIKVINEKFYVVDQVLDIDIPVTSEIISINNFTSEDILNVFLDSMSSDGENKTNKYNRINESFRWQYYQYIDNSDTFDIKYLYDNNEYNISIKGETQSVIYANISYDFVPFEAEYESDYAVITMRSFYPFGEHAMSDYIEFIESFFTEVHNKGIKNVILDIRNNGGGDPMVTSKLFSFIAETSQPYFSKDVPNYYNGLKGDVPLEEPHYNGELYILMNGGSGSSSGHLLALIKYQNLGSFIGEESGASFACTDSSQELILRNSKINFRYSTQKWDVAVEGLEIGRGIMPDFEIINTAVDYVNHVDAAMEFTLNLISNDN